MIDIIWGIFGTAMGLFYAGMQGMVPCLPPAPLSTSVINTDQVRALHFILPLQYVFSEMRQVFAIFKQSLNLLDLAKNGKYLKK